MIRKICLLLSMLFTVCLLSSCGEDEAGALSADKVIITYSASLGEEHETTITDAEVVAEILSALDTIEYNATSRPMDYPRFYIQIYANGERVSFWHIDEK
jgi:ABC-type phosphate/phosphonate transport system substrate-binding protein